MGEMLRFTGRPADSIEFYDRALELHPTLAPALRGKARAKAAVGAWDEAYALQSKRRVERSVPRLDDYVDFQSVGQLPGGTNCTVTFVAGDAFARSDGVKVYLASLARVFPGAKYVLAHDLAKSTVDYVRAFGVTVLPVRSLGQLTRDRWLAVHQLLSVVLHSRCLVSDAKDVVFQRDPFGTCWPTGGLALVSEERTHDELPWNLDQQLGLQISLGVKCEIRDKAVINAGVVCGESHRVRELSRLIYMGIFLSDPDSSDQAVLNFVYQTLLYQESDLQILEPSRSRFCAIGASIRYGEIHEGRDGLSWNGESICGPDGESYALVHQWERTRFAEMVAAHVLAGKPA
jgi:hypothetical protein